MRRKSGKYFDRIPADPDPLTVRVKKRVSFSDVDIMGIVWHGRYTKYFEEGFAAIGREFSLSYKEFYESGLRAPIVQMHVDYHSPLILDEICTIEARMIWNDGARINIEYTIIKEDGQVAATGYTIQMFIDAESQEHFIVTPPLLENCRNKWINGEYAC
ncbi:MAG: acyl-CoA thioesterase [Candidatus Omnitrophica bacterium]|nr:acyl-CoA thioesterase [Candidatus Omnitrophota bacterium]